ncbi:hypothetical protein HYN69_18565 (plasmid) [Gemmobacter aquarius]|uniref:Uncharacterized protein n=1 Tax=Paragemmobacter aquarius TaxID=2169400 RepID=A0A2S0US18_9RHOB|nr:hypothetical protein [Gemmobacter aquarius]AWB50605.1 hypothetical protein HYN69_18565 [Gemmobacter aquarius]
MIRKTLAAALAATLFAGAVFADENTQVRDIDVEADIAAINNPAAAAYWTNVADDLENAIVARITNRTSDDGVKISVDISEVELANAFENVTNVAETKMVGQVNVTSDTDNTEFNSYELTVSVEEALPFFPPGTTVVMITRDTPEYYKAMVEAFAEAVVKRL